MKRMHALLSALVMALPVAAMAQDSGVDNPWAFVLCVENDFFFGHADRYYTNGLRLSWTSPDVPGAQTGVIYNASIIIGTPTGKMLI